MNGSATLAPPEPSVDAEPVLTTSPSVQLQILLTLVGALLTGVTAALIQLLSKGSGAIPWTTSLLLMCAMAVVGVGGRVVRRAVFHGKELSLHQAFSFDVLFQGITSLNPQLAYPDTEREFIRRETGLSAARVTPWFRVRSTSALVIPVGLLAATCFGANEPIAGSALAGIAALVLMARGRNAGPDDHRRSRFLGSVLVGAMTTALEGALFVAMATTMLPQTPLWQAIALYGVTLTAFELSPIPLALGVLECVALGMMVVPGLEVSVAMPFLYRGARLVPVLFFTLFYLARYKLAFRDLYDPFLPLALARTRRPEGGWARSDHHSGPRLSIVIPAYNEEGRLPTYLDDVVAFARELEGGAEVLVVDDGSKDRTPDLVRAVAQREPAVRLLVQEVNQGKGAAVRRGVLEAKGLYVLFADADGATPIREAAKLLAVADSGVEVVIASRKAKSEESQREISLLRSLMGATFYRLTNLLAVPGVSDTQCGFKLFSRTAAERIFPMAKESGWAFDVELLFLAQKIGMAIAEVPVNWTAIDGSKVSPVKDALKMFVAIWRIRRRSAGLVTTLSSGAHR